VKDHFEQIREQIHEIRNFLGPLDVKLEGLDYQIKKSRATFELKTTELETKIASNSSELALHSEQIRQIQIFLKMPQALESRPSASLHDDKQNPAAKPPLNPPE
jgi:hypothetical protein